MHVCLFCTVRLVNGSSDSEGRVEVYYNGTWGTVCDDGWDLYDANVICRMLGFNRALRAPLQAAFGQGAGPITLDNVACLGIEASIAECQHSQYLQHNCQHSEDASVVCYGKTMKNLLPSNLFTLMQIFLP